MASKDGDDREVIRLHGSDDANDNVNPRWWKEEDPGSHLVFVAKSLEKRQSARTTHNRKLARLFQDRPMSSVYSDLTTTVTGDELGAQRVSWNIVRSAIDTADARVGANRVRALFASSGGNWSLRRKARKRTKFIDGVFYQSGVYKETSRCFTDHGVFGVGIAHVFEDDGEVVVERVLPDEIFVDHQEGINGRPRSIYRRHYIHRDVLAEVYPDHADAIQTAPSPRIPGAKGAGDAQQDMVEVWEGYHLRASKKAKDGRHVVAIPGYSDGKGTTLYSHQWTRPRFPYAVLRLADPITGWWGQGLAEQLVGIQLEIRRLLWTISEAQYHSAVPRILAELNSKVNADHFTNDPRGGVVWYTGTPPQFITPGAVSAELYNHLERLWKQGHEGVGIPLYAATGQMPAGLKSGEAIRAHVEATSERLKRMGQRWEQFHVDIAELILDVVNEMGNYSVLAPGKTLERIEWKDIAGDDDDFICQPFPTALLPTEPSGKFERLNDLVQAGWIEKEQALSILDVPDLESVTNLFGAAVEIVGMHLERMLDDGLPETPEPYQNLQLSIQIAQASYLKARTENCPEENLDLVRQYIEQCHDLLTEQNAPAQPQPGPAGAQPPMEPSGPSMGPPPGPPMVPGTATMPAVMPLPVQQ